MKALAPSNQLARPRRQIGLRRDSVDPGLLTAREVLTPPRRPKPPCTIQDLFDQIVTAVRKQGYIKSEGDREACMYLSDDGTRCHVGLLIPPEHYRPEFEGQVPRVLRKNGLFFVGWSEDAMDLLEEFQFIHDDVLPEDWEAAFEALAAQLGLTYHAEGAP